MFKILLMSILAAAPAAAEDTPYWTVQVDPLTTLLGYVHLQVEQRVGTHASVYVGPHFRLFSNPLSEPEPYLGFGMEVGFRVYPFGDAPAGWWLLTRGVVAHVVTTDDSGSLFWALDHAGPPAVGGYVSALGGYTWIYDDWLVLSGGAGVQYIRYRVADYGIEGIFPALHTAVGFAF